MSEAHSYWSASSFAADMLCPGKKVMEQGLPDNANEHAASGTATHQVITWALKAESDAWAYLGRVIQLDERGRVLAAPVKDPAFEFEVDEERCHRAQQCIDYVRDVAGTDGVILVDQRVNYAHALGVEEDTAWGTLDVTVLKGGEIIPIDYKDGKKPVPAGGARDDVPDGMFDPNPQLALYGLGAVNDFGALHSEPITHARLVIIQPRVSSNPSEYDLPVASLHRWAENEAKPAVARVEQARQTHALIGDDPAAAGAWAQFSLHPSDACTFCKAKGICPALRDDMTETMVGRTMATPAEFDTLEAIPVTEDAEMAWLERMVLKADLFESALTAARAELERRMLDGQPAELHKLVQGKKGNRKWVDADAVSKYLRETVRLPLEDAYTLKLKGPAPIEKLAPQLDAKGKPKPLKEGQPEPLIGPRQWAKLQALITQAEGKVHVAPLNDPRPALKATPVVEDFPDVAQAAPAADFSDFA